MEAGTKFLVDIITYTRLWQKMYNEQNLTRAQVGHTTFSVDGITDARHWWAWRRWITKMIAVRRNWQMVLEGRMDRVGGRVTMMASAIDGAKQVVFAPLHLHPSCVWLRAKLWTVVRLFQQRWRQEGSGRAVAYRRHRPGRGTHLQTGSRVN